METSILVAKIVGIIYLSFAVGLIFNKDYYKRVISNMMNNQAYFLFGGIIATILGFVVVSNHVVTEPWTILVCIIGWVALVKGVLLLAFPKFFKFFKPMFASENFNRFLMSTVLVLGLVFAYFGFLA